MARNIYFYFFEDFNNIISITRENFRDIRIIEDDKIIECNMEIYIKDIKKLDENFTNLYSKENYIKLIIIKKSKIISIMSNNYNSIKQVYENKLVEVNLLNNKIFNSIFKHGFSDNLVKINMTTLSSDAIIDDIDMTGNRLHKSDILYNLNNYILEKDTKIHSYSFKPYNYNFIVNIISKNKIVIRDNDITSEDLKKFIYEFTQYIKG